MENKTPIVRLPQGILIALEGIDGSGKTSVATYLQSYFTDLHFSVITTRQPGATPFGQHIRTLLQDRPYTLSSKAEFLLFAADRAQHIEAVVEPALKAGSVVICDRMGDSSLAYQGAGRGLSESMIHQINSWASNDIFPDITIYLKIDWQTALDRLKKRNEKLTHFEQEKIEFFQKVIAKYDQLYTNNPEAIVIDGSLSQEEVQAAVLSGIQKLFHTSNHPSCCDCSPTSTE